MVGHTMRKALKKLEARKLRERKEEGSRSNVHIIDPSHELTQQRKNSTASMPYLHPLGLNSNPELHTSKTNWSSSASVYSFDSASISAISTSPDSPGADDFEDDLDVISFDARACPTRRRSTGSSRAKSQQKLAKILGWNTSFPQWKPATSSQSLENLRCPSLSSSNPSRKHISMIWEESPRSGQQTPDSMPDLKMRQYPMRAWQTPQESVKKVDSRPYDFQMRQFLSARPFKDRESSSRHKKHDSDSSQRSITPTRRNSNPNVHKPLPSTPAFPTFPPITPLQNQVPGMSSTSTPSVTQEDLFSPMPELSAEEASILLSQPAPSELSTESSSERAELPDESTLLNAPAQSRIRSKSPTTPRSNSTSSQVQDFGPGTTLSIIQEEPFEAEDLAKLKVFELPANEPLLYPDQIGNAITTGTSDSCPGLSPSSSLSSRRLRVVEEEHEAELESQADFSTAGNLVRSDSVAQRSEHDLATDDPDAEGEEIIVVFDNRTSLQQIGTNMSGKSFLALDDDDNDGSDDDSDLTDTEQSYRDSIQSESLYTATRNHRSSNLPDDDDDESSETENEDDEYRRSIGADTAKTAYTTSTMKTLVDKEQPDFTGDLAKRNDWL